MARSYPRLPNWSRATVPMISLVPGSPKRRPIFLGTRTSPGTPSFLAFVMELVLTFGLVSVILGTASGVLNVGVIGALGVGAYIAQAGLRDSPISGASTNPARTFGPTLVSMDWGSYWAYVVGPIAGAVIAVVAPRKST